MCVFPIPSWNFEGRSWFFNMQYLWVPDKTLAPHSPRIKGQEKMFTATSSTRSFGRLPFGNKHSWLEDGHSQEVNHIEIMDYPAALDRTRVSE